MKVKVMGPNLSDDSKGTFHVHAADCADLAKYGPGRKLGGDATAGEELTIEITERKEAVFFVYPPGDFEYDAETERAAFENDLFFAPCVKDLA